MDQKTTQNLPSATEEPTIAMHQPRPPGISWSLLQGMDHTDAVEKDV